MHLDVKAQGQTCPVPSSVTSCSASQIYINTLWIQYMYMECAAVQYALFVLVIAAALQCSQLVLEPGLPAKHLWGCVDVDGVM